MRRLAPTSLLIGLLLGASCALPDDDDCDPDQQLTRGYCTAAPTTGGAGSAGAAGSAATLPAGYGEPCGDDTACTAPADFCAKSPFETEGYCTSANCTTNDDCPGELTCLELGIPGVPPYCSQ